MSRKASVKSNTRPVEEKFDFSFETFEFLMALNNKLDVATITIDGVTLNIYKPGDREKMDGYLGIQGIPQARPLGRIESTIPEEKITFHEDARGGIDSNVEFDKEKFFP